MIYYNKDDIRKILLLRNDKIGDLVVSSCAFRELKRAFPDAEITIIASSANKVLVEKNRNIDKIEVLEYPPKGFGGLKNYLKMAGKIRREKFDLGVDLRGSAVNVFLLFSLGGVKHKIGFYNRKASKLFLDYAYKKDRKGMHSTENRIDMINKALDLKAKNYWPDIAIDKNDEKMASDFLKKNKIKKFMVIVPEASLEKKQWKMENFDEIIKYFQKKYPSYKIVIDGADESKINWLVSRNPECVPLLKFNLRGLYLLFKNSGLVIAPDGGPMHLAWAARANLIALMSGYLGINYVGPIGKNSRTLVSEPNNINSISIEGVKKEIDLLMNK